MNNWYLDTFCLHKAQPAFSFLFDSPVDFSWPRCWFVYRASPSSLAKTLWRGEIGSRNGITLKRIFVNRKNTHWLPLDVYMTSASSAWHVKHSLQYEKVHCMMAGNKCLRQSNPIIINMHMWARRSRRQAPSTWISCIHFQWTMSHQTQQQQRYLFHWAGTVLSMEEC